MSTNNMNSVVIDEGLALITAMRIWTAKAALRAEDFSDTSAIPVDLIELGNLPVGDAKLMDPFRALKQRVKRYVNSISVEFLHPKLRLGSKAMADEIIKQMQEFEKDFESLLLDLQNRYDTEQEAWLKKIEGKHPHWVGIIRQRMLSAAQVLNRLAFSWSCTQLQPTGVEAMDKGLEQETARVGGTLFEEVAKDAAETWKKSFQGKSEVTHKALNRIKAMRDKLKALSFTDRRVRPIAKIIDTTLGQIPSEGLIKGTYLQALQSLVLMLRDPDVLADHGQAIIDGTDPKDVMNNWNKTFGLDTPLESQATLPTGEEVEDETEKKAKKLVKSRDKKGKKTDKQVQIESSKLAAEVKAIAKASADEKDSEKPEPEPKAPKAKKAKKSASGKKAKAPKVKAEPESAPEQQEEAPVADTGEQERADDDFELIFGVDPTTNNGNASVSDSEPKEVFEALDGDEEEEDPDALPSLPFEDGDSIFF